MRGETVARPVGQDCGDEAFTETNERLPCPALPRFVGEGKTGATVAIAGTGGRHGSVAAAEELAQAMRALRVGKQDLRMTVLHLGPVGADASDNLAPEQQAADR